MFAASCHTYEKPKEIVAMYEAVKADRSYTIVVRHMECTGCADGYLEEGIVGIPATLKPLFGDVLSQGDLVLKGNFPVDLLSPGTLTSCTKFKITGKVVGVSDADYLLAKAPIFYVEEWDCVDEGR